MKTHTTRHVTLVDWIARGFTLLYGLAGVLVSVHRHWQFETGYYDFGIFDQAIWRVSRFMPPVIDHLAVAGKIIFADHFSPTIFVLSPFYWLTDRSEVILIAQAIVVAASVYALYSFGKRMLKNQLAALSVAFTYALFIGIQNGIITDFHEATLLTLPLVLLFLSIHQGWKNRYFLFLLLCLGIKESMFLTGISVGLFILLTKKSWRTIGIATIGISTLWGFVATKFVIPHFSGGIIQYAPTIPLTIQNLLGAFFDDPIKRQTLTVGFGNFLFLPLLYPPFWPAIFSELASRFFLAQSTLRWGLGLHYGVQFGVLLAVSSVYALTWLQNKLPKTFILGICIALPMLAVYLHQFKLHGPLGLAYNPAFYRHSTDFEFLHTLIRRIPPGASVMTQNNLASHFTHQTVYLFRREYDPILPDYIVFDLRDGQNPNNYFPQDITKLSYLRNKLIRDPRYTVIYQTRDQAIFQKMEN